MAQDLTAYEAMLKVEYAPKGADVMDHSTVLADTLERTTPTMNVDGKTYTKVLETGYNQAIASIPEKGAVPATRNVQTTAVIVPMKYHVGGIGFTKVVMEASKSNRGAFAKAAELETRMMLKGMLKNWNRQLLGDGTGALATCVGADDVSPIPIDDGQGVNHHHVEKDMLVDVLNYDDSYKILNATGNGIRVTSTGIITGVAQLYATGGVDGLAGTADNDIFVRHGINNATTIAAPTEWYEIIGLEGIVDTSNPPVGNLQGVDRTAAGNLFWQAGDGLGEIAVNDDLNDDYIQQAVDVVEKWGTVGLILSNQGVRRNFFNHLSADRRYLVKTDAVYGGGFKAIEYNSHPFVVDTACKRKTMYVIDPSVLEIDVMTPWQWLDDDGHVLHRVTDRTLAFEAIYFGFNNLGVTNCRPMCKLTGVNE